MSATEAKRPVGRPPIGPTIQIRLETEQLAKLDGYAKAHDISRAEAIRQILQEKLR